MSSRATGRPKGCSPIAFRRWLADESFLAAREWLELDGWEVDKVPDRQLLRATDLKAGIAQATFVVSPLGFTRDRAEKLAREARARWSRLTGKGSASGAAE